MTITKASLINSICNTSNLPKQESISTTEREKSSDCYRYEIESEKGVVNKQMANSANLSN
jgi:hypothetical protein